VLAALIAMLMLLCAAPATACSMLIHCPAEQDMQIMNKHGAAVKEMEAAAIAWVAQLFRKPMFCVKAVTDIVDGDRATQEEFLENLNAAAAALQQTLPKVLEFVSGKTISQL
jgi:5'-methylthioadenosine nucleosidase